MRFRILLDQEGNRLSPNNDIHLNSMSFGAVLSPQDILCLAGFRVGDWENARSKGEAGMGDSSACLQLSFIYCDHSLLC